ncbi:Endo-chitosanase [Fusarium sp. LHS14.1]|nr:Endo-chitosanase [Fusarium sp. LHS14.1]
MLYQSLVPLLLASSASALQVPSNVRAFYNQLKSKGTCTNRLATGFFDSKFDDGETSYCGDHLEDYGIVYLQGEGGTFSNMDVDCDGAQGGPQDDGRCGESTTTIPTTSIKYIIEGYNVGISDLNPHEHSFVVFGNSGTKPGWKTFDPREVGVQKASLMAVVCGDQMFYGIWGDSNGDHGDRPSVGEASLSLATACYGKGMQAGTGSNTSHDEEDVLYIAFTGADAVPGAKGAAWTAGNFDDFHASLVGLGNKLIKRIGGGDDCSWPGHCEGASCKVAQDCSDALTCVNGKCAQEQLS